MRITTRLILPLLAGLAVPATAQTTSGYDFYTPFGFNKAAAAATTPASASLATPPANTEKTPASAVPETQPSVGPVPEPSSIGAFVLPVADPVLATSSRLARGASIKDATGLATAAVVSAGSDLAIIMVGPHRIQVPASSITGTTTLAVAMTPDQVANLLALSEKFQAETAKLKKVSGN